MTQVTSQRQFQLCSEAPVPSALICDVLILPQIQMCFWVDVSEGVMIKHIEFADLHHLPWPWIGQLSEDPFPSLYNRVRT